MQLLLVKLLLLWVNLKRPLILNFCLNFEVRGFSSSGNFLFYFTTSWPEDRDSSSFYSCALELMLLRSSKKMQTILLILLVLVATVRCNNPTPVVDVPSEDYRTLQNGLYIYDITTSSRTSPMVETPAKDKSIGIDLSQRLFYANHLDSKFDRRTLDLSGLGLSGDDVMKILYSLNSTTLDSVARLDLSHNRVRSLPPRVWPLHLEYTLRELRLDHNQLDTDDPDSRKATNFELCRLARLEKLSLSDNGLACRARLRVPELAFPRNVKSLDLSNNHLAYIPMTLVFLRRLRHLDLSGNRIRSLDQAALTSLIGLYTLNLSSNGVQQPWGRVGAWDPLEKLVHLKTLRLDNNLLAEPPRLAHFCGTYRPQTEVYIGDNPLECSCYFNDTLDIGRVVIADSANVTCVDEFGIKRSWNDPFPGCSIPILTKYGIKARFTWAAVKDWVLDVCPHWSTLFQLLGWTLFGVTLGIVYAKRRSTKTSPLAQASFLPCNNPGGRVSY